MEITGKLIRIDIPETFDGKNGKSYTKQLFVLETEEQYPKKLCFTSMVQGVIEGLENYKLGYKMTVHFNIESREWNEAYFTNLTAYRIEGDPGNK